MQYIEFKNWPTKYDAVCNHEIETERRNRYNFLLFELYFEHLSIADRAKKLKMSTGYYRELRRRYKPYTKEEWENEELLENIRAHIITSLK